MKIIDLNLVSRSLKKIKINYKMKEKVSKGILVIIHSTVKHRYK